MLKPLFTKRGRPPEHKRYCSNCARPKDSTRFEWALMDEVVINGEQAFKSRTRHSRPIVCDRCGEKTNFFYEVLPEKPPLSVVEIEEEEHQEWVAFTAGAVLGFLMGIAATLLLQSGALAIVRGIIELAP